MKALSICSGIGGLDLAAEAANISVVAQVEIDPFCQTVLEAHWPDIPRYSGPTLAHSQGVTEREPDDQTNSDTTGRTSWEIPGSRGWRPTEPRLGGATHGFPARMDQPPYGWEAPQTTTNNDNHALRLKALGNAVVWQQAYPIFVALVTADTND